MKLALTGFISDIQYDVGEDQDKVCLDIVFPAQDKDYEIKQYDFYWFHANNPEYLFVKGEQVIVIWDTDLEMVTRMRLK